MLASILGMQDLRLAARGEPTPPWRWSILLLLMLLLVSIVAAPAWASDASAGKEVRLALVIANGRYRDLPVLENTYSDGDRIAAALAR